MNEKPTLDWLAGQLEAIIGQGSDLLRQIGFDEQLEIYGLVIADEENPNTKYRLASIDKILFELYKAMTTLDFLRRRESKEVHTMVYFPKERRYGYYDKNGVPVEFHCGRCLEALLQDDEGKQHWIPTSIEYDQKRFYLVRHGNVPLDGLLIRDGR